MAETPTRNGLLKGLQCLLAGPPVIPTNNCSGPAECDKDSESPLKKSKVEHDFSFTPRKDHDHMNNADFITQSPPGSCRQSKAAPRTTDSSKPRMVPKKLDYDADLQQQRVQQKPQPVAHQAAPLEHHEHTRPNTHTHGEPKAGVIESLFSPVYKAFMKHFEGSDGELEQHVPEVENVLEPRRNSDECELLEDADSTEPSESTSDEEGEEAPAPAEDQEEEEEDDEGNDEFDPFSFIRTLPPLTAEQKNRYINLPAKSTHAPKVTLVLDLDETLVHCSTEPIDNVDLSFDIDFKGSKFKINVRTRPHLREFMDYITDRFEVIVFTASLSVYADALLDRLDPKKKCFRHRMFRESCVTVDGNYIKELSAMGRGLSNIVIVDNCISAFGYNMENGIPIESWYDDKNDTELLKLIPFLEHLNTVKDVRPAVLDKFQLHKNLENFVPNF